MLSTLFKNICWCLLAVGVTGAFWLSMGGCVGHPLKISPETENRYALVWGVVEVETQGPNPRAFPTEVRFVDMVHVETGERIRLPFTSRQTRFAVQLPEGRYRITRLQVQEGPFKGEAEPHASFSVEPDRVVFLGTWRFLVETPRTQRMVTMKVSDTLPAFSQILQDHPAFEGKSLEVALATPPSDPFRLFSVAPYPKYRYFYRN